mgnify:CR=1 FL=1
MAGVRGFTHGVVIVLFLESIFVILSFQLLYII